MKALAMLLLYAGYSLVVYGVDHVTGHCTPFKSVIWVGTTSSVDCGGGPAGAPTTSTGSSVGNALNNGGSATNLPGAGTSGGSGHPTTVPVTGPNYSIPGQGYTVGNPHRLSYTNLNL
jgi:hypothetical protein